MRRSRLVYRGEVAAKCLFRWSAALVIVVVSALPAAAGMPTITYETFIGVADTGLERLEVISFFFLVTLIAAGIIQRVWNGLRADFPRLPRISFARSLGIVFLWSLLFIFVLTMISGARELMTPGAWEKHGVTYRLVSTG